MLIPWWVWVNSVVFYLLTNASSVFFGKIKKKEKWIWMGMRGNVVCQHVSEAIK